MLREGLHLHSGGAIIVLTFNLEVESLIELAVSEVVAEQSSLEPHRQDLTDKLVQALETDASWVELYGVTGELAVPGITPSEDEFGAGLRQVMEVRALWLH